MAEDGVLFTLGSTYGYTDAELDAMPLWLVAVRLGIAEGSDGYPRGVRQVLSRGDIRRQEEAAEKKAGASGRKGRGRPETWVPQNQDPGRIFRGEGAR